MVKYPTALVYDFNFICDKESDIKTDLCRKIYNKMHEELP
jgi:hypothetical protein